MVTVLRLLGETSLDGVVVTRQRERDLLAVLASARGPVLDDRLLAELWGGEASRACLQVTVSRARAFLGAGRPGLGIERTPAGYRLRADAVDVWELERVAEVALSAATARERLHAATRAAELWTGEPYAGTEAPSVRAEATRLLDLHLSVEEARGEALVELGHAAAAVRLLAPLAPEHPYREQLWATLARAQYACARQAEALATLAALRERLAEDLGVDPSALVRDTEQRILVQDAALAAAPAAVRAHRRRVRTRHCRAGSVTRPVRLAG